jgi:ABC-type sugar transport system ATPase subunit
VQDGPSLELTVEVVEPLGNLVLVHGTTGGTGVSVAVGEEEELPSLISGARAAMTVIFPPELEPAPGDRVRVGIDPDDVHLFDLKTGAAVRSGAER